MAEVIQGVLLLASIIPNPYMLAARPRLAATTLYGADQSKKRAARDARNRVGHLGSTLVAALLGGTGVGKSSLLNALAGGCAGMILASAQVYPELWQQVLAAVQGRMTRGGFRSMDTNSGN